MYSTYHYQSATEINSDLVEAIKTSFKGRPVVITVEEETDETAFLLSDPVNRDMIMQSLAEYKNGESIVVNITGE